MAESFRIDGLRDLQKAMQTLSADMAGKIARQATAAGAGVVRKAARQNAPKDTGALRAGIVMKRVKNTKLTSEYVLKISTQEMKKYVKNSRYARIELQGPTKQRGGRLYAIKDEYEDYGDLFYGRFIEFGTVKMPARPFMGPALRDNITPATEAMKTRLRARLKKAGAL